ncbi:MAG: hypothetical protein PVI90_01795 [Desulfobacteraceae bacterium]|jgi:hypothetical protein
MPSIYLTVGCQSTSSAINPSVENYEMTSADSMDDFIVVDCMPPGQVRKLGKMIYQTPRRPLKTTAVETLKKTTQNFKQQQIVELSQEIILRKTKLEKQRREALKLKSEKDQLSRQAERYRARIAAYKYQIKDIDGSKIEIIDPKLLATRSKAIIAYEPGNITKRNHRKGYRTSRFILSKS